MGAPARSICLATRTKNTSGATRATARKPGRTFGCRVALFSVCVRCAHGKQAIPAQQRVKLLGYEPKMRVAPSCSPPSFHSFERSPGPDARRRADEREALG